MFLMLKELMQNQYAWAILSICTVGSLLFAIYTWIKGADKKELSYFHVSHAITRGGKNLIPAIKITYNDMEITNLTSTKLAIWNSGNRVVNRSDVVVGREVCIGAPDSVGILYVEIIAESDVTNKFELSNTSPNTQKISFEYIDKHEGVVLQIFHTGNHDDISVDCKIKGGKSVKSVSQKMTKTRLTSMINSNKGASVFCDIFAVSITFLTCTLVFSLFDSRLFQILYAPPSEGLNLLFVVFATIYTIMMDILSVKITKRAFHLSVPSDLRKHM